MLRIRRIVTAGRVFFVLRCVQVLYRRIGNGRITVLRRGIRPEHQLCEVLDIPLRSLDRTEGQLLQHEAEGIGGGDGLLDDLDMDRLITDHALLTDLLSAASNCGLMRQTT